MQTADSRKDSKGEATKERMIVAALELFGRKGFESVGAREIALAAKVPLSAIPYHFGTKETLYRAALQRTSSRMAPLVAGAVADAKQVLLKGSASDAKAEIAKLLTVLLEVVACNPESESWARLLLREHLDPGPAFEIVYTDTTRGILEILAALIAKASNQHVDDKAVLIEAFARLGEVLIFRTARTAIIRRMGWSDLGTVETNSIASVLASMSQKE
jgi:TetR/AcrR family transcriptional regulator, regulator of cefoperazone and chloramphenicol sensitivity